MNYKELICLQRTKELVLQLKKRGVVCILGENFLEKPVHFSVKNTANNAGTCIGQQIQLYTSWSEQRQHKFTDTGNNMRGAFNKLPDFFVQAFKIVVDSWKFTMLLLYILWDDWPIFMISGSNEQRQQEFEYTLIVTAGEFQKCNLDVRKNDIQ